MTVDRACILHRLVALPFPRTVALTTNRTVDYASWRSTTTAARVTGLDRRIKYYGIQAAALFLSGLILLVALLWSPGWGLWCAALPLCAAIGGAGWWLSRRFTADTTRHLKPQEWAELRGALEDVPVLSVLHLFKQDKKRLARFRYIPLLQQSLWEVLAEDLVDLNRVARIAFLLHTFNQDLKEYAEAFPVIEDPVVLAWLMDLAAEPGQLTRRHHLAQQLHRLPTLIDELGTGLPGIDEPNDDPGQQAAWRVMLFGPLALDPLRAALDHDNPAVREASMALMTLQEQWPTRRPDLLRRLNQDEHPSVRHGALEILALEGPQNLPIIQRCLQDPVLAERATELMRELS